MADKLTNAQEQKILNYAYRYASNSNDDVELLVSNGTYKAIDETENGAWVLARVWVPAEIYKGENDDTDD